MDLFDSAGEMREFVAGNETISKLIIALCKRSSNPVPVGDVLPRLGVLPKKTHFHFQLISIRFHFLSRDSRSATAVASIVYYFTPLRPPDRPGIPIEIYPVPLLVRVLA